MLSLEEDYSFPPDKANVLRDIFCAKVETGSNTGGSCSRTKTQYSTLSLLALMKMVFILFLQNFSRCFRVVFSPKTFLFRSLLFSPSLAQMGLKMNLLCLRCKILLWYLTLHFYFSYNMFSIGRGKKINKKKALSSSVGCASGCGHNLSCSFTLLNLLYSFHVLSLSCLFVFFKPLEGREDGRS